MGQDSSLSNSKVASGKQILTKRNKDLKKNEWKVLIDFCRKEADTWPSSNFFLSPLFTTSFFFYYSFSNHGFSDFTYSVHVWSLYCINLQE